MPNKKDKLKEPDSKESAIHLWIKQLKTYKRTKKCEDLNTVLKDHIQIPTKLK